MARFLEGIFVLGCALVGLGMSAPDGSRIQDTVQLVALVQNNVATKLISHVGRFDLRLGCFR